MLIKFNIVGSAPRNLTLKRVENPTNQAFDIRWDSPTETTNFVLDCSPIYSVFLLSSDSLQNISALVNGMLIASLKILITFNFIKYRSFVKYNQIFNLSHPLNLLVYKT